MSAEEILTRSDESRGNLAGITWVLSIDAIEGGRSSNRTIEVQSRGYDVVAEIIEPPKRRGQKLLMVKGNMWFYKPNLSKPVPISQRQKLLGLAANGDISATNYAKDYAVIAKSEVKYAGMECYFFDLEAKSPGATYSRIRYWVDKQRLVGIRSEFYNARGDKLLKSAEMTYNYRVEMPDGARPFISQMTIRDEIISADFTTLNFSEPKLQSLPDHIFNINLLR